MIMSCLPTIFKRSAKPQYEKTAGRRPSLFSIKSNRSTKSDKSTRSRSSDGSYHNKRQSQVYELTDRRWYMYTVTQPDGEVEKTMVALPPAVAERLNLSLKHDDDSEPPSPRTASIPIPSDPLALSSVLPPSPTAVSHERQKSNATFLTMGTFHDRDHHYEDTITRLYDEEEVW
ncbi:hypothetical protein DRE_01148 [Drechslerella stenobrocha 248]|uniref:Uncharacterized protein n=1 Tax=Drechslerella stenobrocha 248 TaxID=1043628 RepID=W7HW77_9PEZI|nr:hypothetical protein DRE_01148 [Drechslerella stenobrocha 248]